MTTTIGGKRTHGFDFGPQGLLDFNERVERVRDFGFVRLIEEDSLPTVVQVGLGEPTSPAARLPTQEQVDAFVNNLRFFIQDNEPISFRNLSKCYETLPLPPRLKVELAECRGRLNTWLDSKSCLGVGTGPLLNRQILEVFVYGDIAHNNPEKRETLKCWREKPLFFPLLKTHFVNLMARFMKFLDETSALNVLALADLRRKT